MNDGHAGAEMGDGGLGEWHHFLFFFLSTHPQINT